MLFLITLRFLLVFLVPLCYISYMTDLQKRILGLVLTSVISLIVGIAGCFGIQILAGCTSTGSANWDINTDIKPVNPVVVPIS